MIQLNDFMKEKFEKIFIYNSINQVLVQTFLNSVISSSYVDVGCDETCTNCENSESLRNPES